MSQSITLRQAHKLVDKINAKIRTISIRPVATLNVWEVEDAASSLEKLTQTFNTNLKRVQDLTEVRNVIRLTIQHENHDSGIDTTIAERKKVLDRLTLASSLTVNEDYAAHVTSGLALAKKIDSLRKESHATNYHAADTVAVSLLSEQYQESLGNQISDYKKTVEELEDRLLHLNTSTKINLSAELVAVLKNERLI